ncbi:MAG TPA: ferric reductase-like transmembrane domain-containing protein [Kofleriaceae bacterium]|nr:ferric reductase-like transmembrane domain-containing protein [Kofleriaceae bacterium]
MAEQTSARAAVHGLVVGIVVLAVAGALAARLGLAAIEVPRSASTAPWLFTRAAGITAFVALALDVIIGLLVSTRTSGALFAKGAAVELHRWLSPLALGLVLGHVGLLLADGYIRFDALDVLVPFASSYRPVAVGIGVVAAYLALVIHASFALRKRLGARTWRRLHYLSFVALIGAALHGVLAGSDSGNAWVRALYAVPLVVVTALLALRLGRAFSTRR